MMQVGLLTSAYRGPTTVQEKQHCDGRVESRQITAAQPFTGLLAPSSLLKFSTDGARGALKCL